MKFKVAVSVFCGVTLFASVGFSQQAKFPAFSAEAHRGGRGLYPENTITAMLQTMKIDGITTLEMDTHITKDGKVVVTHDDYLSPAFMLTPEGKEIPVTDAKKYPVFGMNYDELRKFDLGTKYFDQFPKQQKSKQYIPLLNSLIDSVQAKTKKTKSKQFFYNIETKCSEKGDGVTNPEPEVFVKLLMDVIEKKKIMPYVVIQSFDKRTIQIINQKYPKVKTSFLVANKKSYEENIADLGYKPFILSPVWQMVNEEMVAKAHADGVKIVPWTANTAEDIKKLKALKVDGIISDYPDVLVQTKL
ncbi:glycerophosphodiester phosphodiesterase family protein [Pedobacter sp. MC2016-05]|uniref:glycerophosphodiester phosphodiesterase family protein n=1 Tax=Pedobacter sp. MC2016-05 TaxID=2994474 RepID=UPI00224651BC|nr:glycerophosphodiester phosphodiesterase family protein [Pedobacter sp. MC2016-05]MCX2476159.1 glycerophosphodiester phosphodiesterase family protein [Pedobacter sp. MC2016-05]